MTYDLDRIIEHVPLFNGGGRRRLITGTIVVLSAVVCVDPLRDYAAANIVASKDVSWPATFAAILIVYAVGVVVELLGEMIISRAVANSLAAFDFAWTHECAWTRAIQNDNKLWLIKILYTAVFGTVLVTPYILAIGFESRKFPRIKHWRMNLNSLSSKGKQAFDSLSPEIRDAIQSPLEKKGEFGRMALVTRFSTPDRRRWARAMIEWPRNLLSTVSAISIGLLIFTLASSPSMASAATLQSACAATILFLYAAFFATLNATTISLLEALALESPSIVNSSAPERVCTVSEEFDLPEGSVCK